MIKAIMFDYIGVLASNFGRSFYGFLNKITNKPLDEINIIFRKHWNKLKIGEIKDDEFWKEMAKDFSLSPQNIEEAKKVALEICEPKQEMLDLVKELSKKYNLYILSNSCHGWTEYSYERNGLKPYFKNAFFSHNLKLTKPNPEIYQEAIKQIGLKPEEIIFIDDRPENVIAAEKEGMKGITFKDSNSLKESLNQIIQ